MSTDTILSKYKIQIHFDIGDIEKRIKNLNGSKLFILILYKSKTKFFI